MLIFTAYGSMSMCLCLTKVVILNIDVGDIYSVQSTVCGLSKGLPSLYIRCGKTPLATLISACADRPWDLLYMLVGSL